MLTSDEEDETWSFVVYFLSSLCYRYGGCIPFLFIKFESPPRRRRGGGFELKTTLRKPPGVFSKSKPPPIENRLGVVSQGGFG